MLDRPSRRAFLPMVAGATWSLPALVRTAVEAATYFEQGREQFRRGEWGAALVSVTKAIEIVSTDEAALDLRSVVLDALGNHGQALMDRTAILQLNPSPINFFLRGVLAMGHDPQLAIADFSERIRQEPTHPDAYYVRAVVYEEAGRLDLALADYRAAQVLDPEDAEALAQNIARVERLLRKG
jgi:Flp pilus assembly protein TadD